MPARKAFGLVLKSDELKYGYQDLTQPIVECRSKHQRYLCKVVDIWASIEERRSTNNAIVSGEVDDGHIRTDKSGWLDWLSSSRKMWHFIWKTSAGDNIFQEMSPRYSTLTDTPRSRNPNTGGMCVPAALMKASIQLLVATFRGGGQNCINSFLVRVPNLERRTFCKKSTAIMFSNSLANTGLVTVGQGWIYSYKLKTSHERSAQMLPILIKRKCYSQQKSK